jgi:hypothetical protein
VKYNLASRFLPFVVGLIIVVVGGAIAFPRISSGLFFSWDSAVYVSNGKEYLQNGTVTGLIASYTQSFGNLAFPMNFNLVPEARLAYFGGYIHPVAFYLIASSLLFGSTYILARSIGFGSPTSLISGLALVGLTMPYTSPPIYSESFWWYAPYWTLLLYSLSALVVTFHFTGRLGTIGNL